MRFPAIDPFSFWLGFFAAWAVVALIWANRRHLVYLRDQTYDSLRGVRERLTQGTERNWRADTYRYAQSAHLAGALFALDDVLIPPRFWPPQPEVDPARPLPDEDLNTIIPQLPDAPGLAALYRAPTLSLESVLNGSQSIVILAGPGSGKTTALAHLASRAAQYDETLFPDAPTPIFVHAADLELPPRSKDDLLQPLIAAAQMRASALTAATLARHLRLRLREFNCVLLLDGFDELPAAQTQTAADWLGRFRKQYPAHRVIAAAGAVGYGPLTSLGLAPLWLAPFTPDEQSQLAVRWSEAWARARGRAARKPGPGDVDAHILLGWLSLGNRGRTPAELTLKIWAGFMGDARGPRPADALEAYLARHGVNAAGRRLLGKLALAALAAQDAAGVARSAARELAAPLVARPDGQFEVEPNAFLDQLIAQRVLIRQGRDRLNFRHPLALAYCAAAALAAEPTTAAYPASTALTPLWVWTLYFLAALGDLTPAVKQLLSQPPDVLQTEPLTCALWLRDSPPGAPWRNDILRRLSKLVTDRTLPETLRARALAGFVAAQEPAAVALFKQALASPDPFTRRLAALALGALGDGSVVPALAALFNDPYLDVRWAAALALSVQATEAAVNVLKQGLFTGDDGVRQACAQALARHPEAGHELLKEAVTSPEISTRRAAILGLAEIGADWANQIIEVRQRDETEWYVRNAANEVVARLKEPPDRAPHPYTPPEAQGWLITWAAGHGAGVPPGRGAIEILNRALREGDEPVRIAAADALARLGDPAGARDLYTALRDPEYPLVRDAAYRALAQLAAATGQRMHAPLA